MRDRQWFVLYVLVCLEIGVFLLLVPWSTVWERNYFLDLHPWLRPLLLDPAVRGAVAGLGLANVYVGLSELFRRWVGRESTSHALDEERPHLDGGERASASECESLPEKQTKRASEYGRKPKRTLLTTENGVRRGP